MVHFSCHATNDRANPAASRLILHDHRTDPLTVADINTLPLAGALAFLSACDTGSNSPRLADEALHLTGAFHLAGYQNVIGTLQPVAADAAARIAAGFYVYLTENGAFPPKTAMAAYALHRALRAERAKYPSTPTHWVAHTHTGI